jgi:hypothetical protein
MTTHKIATPPNGEPRTVETLHRAGIWAVHADIGETLLGVYYYVTHTPTGARAPWSPSTKEEAVALADALNTAHPAFGVDAPWGKPPPIAGLVPSIDEICVNAMSPRARSVWGEP